MSASAKEFSDIYQKYPREDIEEKVGILTGMRKGYDSGSKGKEEFKEDIEKRYDGNRYALPIRGSTIFCSKEIVEDTLKSLDLVEDMTETEFFDASKIANDPNLDEYREYIKKMKSV